MLLQETRKKRNDSDTYKLALCVCIFLTIPLSLVSLTHFLKKKKKKKKDPVREAPIRSTRNVRLMMALTFQKGQIDTNYGSWSLCLAWGGVNIIIVHQSHLVLHMSNWHYNYPLFLIWLLFFLQLTKVSHLGQVHPFKPLPEQFRYCLHVLFFFGWEESLSFFLFSNLSQNREAKKGEREWRLYIVRLVVAPEITDWYLATDRWIRPITRHAFLHTKGERTYRAWKVY